jgi:predicted nucleic acid-binding protein
MKVGLDTSVVLCLLVGQPVDQAQRAVAFLDELSRRGDQPVVADLVVAEVYFALQHHYGVAKRDALEGLGHLFASREIESTGYAAEVLKTDGLASARPGFIDRLIHQAYVEKGGSMATFEKEAARLKSVRVL